MKKMILSGNDWHVTEAGGGGKSWLCDGRMSVFGTSELERLAQSALPGLFGADFALEQMVCRDFSQVSASGDQCAVARRLASCDAGREEARHSRALDRSYGFSFLGNAKCRPSD